MSGQKRTGNLDLTKGSLPVLATITLLCMVAAAAYGVGGFVNSLVSDKQISEAKFEEIKRELSGIKGLIENGNFVRRSEFEQWCRNIEILNRGFKCGNIK